MTKPTICQGQLNVFVIIVRLKFNEEKTHIRLSKIVSCLKIFENHEFACINHDEHYRAI